MTVLDTFYLLFKSDASAVQADMDKLGKKIDDLKAKGKSRSEQESKDLKEAIKQHKELAQTLNESAGATGKFVNSLTDAAAALVSFNAIRNGIADSSKFNSNLVVQSKLLLQSAHAMGVVANAAEAMGGSREGVMADMAAWSNQAIQSGIQPGSYTDYLKRIKTNVAGISGKDADIGRRQYLDAIGINDPGTRSMLLDGKKWDEGFAIGEKNTPSDQELESGRQIQGDVSNIRQNIEKMYTKIGAMFPETSGVIASPIGSAFEGVATLAGLKYLFGGAKGAGGIGLAGGLSKMGLWGAIAWGAYVDYQLIKNHSSAADWIDKKNMNPFYWGKKGGGQSYKGATPSGAIAGDAKAFWMAQGYSAEDAAAIISNEYHESGHKPGARGDGGRAHGLFQWQNTRNNGFRRDAILKATGIDVSTAGADDQRRAALWEMKNGNTGFDDAYFRSLKGADAKAAYFSRTFARPGDEIGEAMKRGRTALEIVNGTSWGAQAGGTKTVSVKIDKIDINTQATDANGIAKSIGDHLTSTMRGIAMQHDDGISA